MPNLPISVIVVARNAEKTIEECLSSVKRNNPAEIIVVDGNSSDRTVEIARRFTHRIYSDDGRGLGYARQLGAEQAREEYIAYVDADITLMEGTLATMLDELRGLDYISVHAEVSPDTRCSNYWQRAQLQHELFLRSRDYIGMMASLFKRETVMKYGFDLSPSAKQIEDLSLEFELKKDGYRFGASSAVIYRYYEESLGNLVAHRFLTSRYMPRAIWNYGPWHAGFWLPLATLYWLGYCLIKGKLSLFPYFMVNGVVETAAMIKGFIELIGEQAKRS